MDDELADVLDKFEETLNGERDPPSETTINRYLYELPKWADWLEQERGKDILQTTTADFRVHLREMHSDGYADTTVNCRRSAISRFYQKLPKIAEDYSDQFDFDPEDVPANPSENLDPNDWPWASGETKTSEGLRGDGSDEGVHYLESDEVADLVSNVPSPTLRNELILRLLYDTGVRRSELAQVTVNDIDRDDHKIWIPAIKSPRPRWVTYTPDYSGWHLQQWLDDGYRGSTYYARMEDSPYLFPTNESIHISGYRINEIVREAAENADLQAIIGDYAGDDDRKVRKVTAHTLRHSHAVQAVKSEIDVRRLAESMGHVSKDGEVNIGTTMVYLRLAEKEYVDESRKFDP